MEQLKIDRTRAILGCAVALLLAQSGSPARADIVPPGSEVGESPVSFLTGPAGHKIDLLTGYVSFRNVDMEVAGNGGRLPITVSRVYDINRSAPALRVPMALGNWDLEVPRITAWRGIKRSDNLSVPYASSPSVWSAGYCNNPVYRQGNSDPKYDLFYWQGLSLDIPGAGTRQLLFDYQQVAGNRVIVYPNIISITGTKGGPKYVTTDNWRADCLDLPQGAKSGFTVYAPNGTKYTFDKFASPRSKVNETNGWWHSLGAYVYPSRIEDIHGNYLTYEYVSDANEGLYVSQITGSDGRRVRFNYDTIDLSTHPFWKPKSTVKRLSSVEQLSDDGATVLLRVEYNYYVSNVPSTIYTANGTLASVKRPDGRYWNYDYEDNKRAQPGQTPDQWNDYPECERWSAVWICLPNYSTYPARLKTVGIPEGITYRYYYEEWENHFGRVNPRAFSANGYSNRSWWLDKIEVDLDLDSNPEVIDLTLDQTYNRYRATVDYPWGRRDVYYFYPLYFAEGSQTSHARFADMRGSLLASQEVWDTSISTTSPQLLQKTDYDWRRDHIVGDNTAECWIQECDKPNLWNVVLLSTSTQVNGKTFTTSFSNFDEFGQPRSVDETGTRARSARLTYKNDTSRWLIGNVDREEVLTEGAVTRVFNDLGDMTSTSLFGLSKSYEYFPSGDVNKVKWQRTSGGAIASHTFENYKRGIPRKWIDPLGNTAQVTVNDSGTIATESDRRGNTVASVYDTANRLRFSTPPSPYVRTATDWYFYHPREIREVTGTSQMDTREDQHGRVIWQGTRDTTLGSSLAYQEIKYDRGGRAIFESRAATALGNTTSGLAKTYDALNRILTIRDVATNHQVRYCYGTACNASRVGMPPVQHGYVITDSEGYESVVNFESFGSPLGGAAAEIIRQTQLTPAKYITTTITRNLIGQITQVTQGGVTRAYEYYPNKLLYKIIEPETGTTTHTYDLAGNLLTRTVGSAASTTLTYNDRNELKKVSSGEAGTSDIEFDYDPSGNPKWSKQGSIVRTATFDVLNQLDIETLATPGVSLSWRKEYDGSGGLRRVTYPTGMVVNYQPNAFGQATQAVATIGSLFTRNLATNVTFTPSRQLSTFSYGNGLLFSRTENTRGLIQQLRVRNSQSQSRLDLTYGYDGRGNVTSISDAVDAASSKTLSYDGLERLIGVTSPGGNEGFEYDDASNLKTMSKNGVSTTLAFDGTNRLASTSTGRVFNYDLSGNVAFNGLNTFLFDAHGQLRELGGAQSRQYDYDGSKYRVLKRNGRNDVVSVFSTSGQLLTELDRRTGESRDYVYLGRQALAAVSCTRTSADADGDGIPNCFEVRWGLSEQNASDAAMDSDGDGATNLEEYSASTDPRITDSDGDGIPDGYEIHHKLDALWNDAAEDFDHDQISNLVEYQRGTPADFNPAWIIPVLDMLLN